MPGALTEEHFLSGLEEAGFHAIAVLGKSYWKDVEGYSFFSITVRGFKFEKQAGCAFVGQVDLTFSGTGTDTKTGAKAAYSFHTDTRFMKGDFIGSDERMHSGAFAFI